MSTGQTSPVELIPPEPDFELPKVSAVIAASDAEDLSWYFRSGGLGIFMPSSTGTLIDRLKLMAPGRPCDNCGGDAETGRSGCGFVVTKLRGKPPSADQRLVMAMLEIDIPDEMPPGADQVCKECDGRGWVMGRFSSAKKPLTARPTGSSKRGGGGGVNVSGENLEKLGRVSGRLSAVRSRQGAVPADLALEAFYAPGGGSTAALWELVPAGKTMLRRNSQKLPPTQFFANERADQADKPNANRDQQFRTAERQSTELHVAACLIWNSCRSAK